MNVSVKDDMHRVKEWSSWMGIYVDYRESLKKIDNYITSFKNRTRANGITAEEEVQFELLGSMRVDLREAVGEMKRKTLYGFGTLNEDDLDNPLLTERQREVARLRQSHSCTEVARMLELDPSTVFRAYKQAIRKIKKYKEKEKEGIPPELTPQQSRIYILYKRGLKPRVIAERIGTSYGNVRKQLSLIRNVTGITQK